jgi:hypothetical protein
MKKPRTFHDGLNTERTAWMAKLRRMANDPLNVDSGVSWMFGLLIEWGEKRTARNKRRPGGA